MNDPGFEDAIAQGANNVENERGDDESDGAADNEAYLQPSRWWFASTAFPLLAGTFGPMASAFNICALAPRWRVALGPGMTEDTAESVQDPPWLIGINAVSLVLALTANVALLFNMARRLPFSIAQPITIVGWYLASFLLIGLVAAASYAPSMRLPPERNPALTGAYYYAIMAAALYIIVASLMMFTVWGAHKKHYSSTFQLTMSQRTLMLQTIAYLVYLLGGAAVYAKIEGWLFLDAVWWANYTLLTIGIGDFHVLTNVGKGILFPYAIGGIVVLGLVVGSIRSLVLERGKEKMAARMVEKKRERVLRRLSDNDSKVRVSHFSPKVALHPGSGGEQKRRKDEFRLMRIIQHHAETRRKWTSLIISISAWLLLWVVGAAIFYVAEYHIQGLSYFEWLYFSYTSLLTIGYGDYTLLSNAGKAFFVLWSLLAIPTLTILISNMGDTVIKSIRDLTIWLGAITVLPGEGSTRTAVQAVAQKIKPGKAAREHGLGDEQPGDAQLPEPDRDRDPEKAGADAQRTPQTATTKASEKLGGEFEAQELDEAEAARSRGDALGEDTHLYHYLLVKEIRKVMKDVGEDPPKRYGYAEWAWFLRLLGEDEADTRYHRKAPPPGKRPGDQASDAASEQSEGKQVQTAGGPGSGVEAPYSGAKSTADTTPWSWVGQRSPLMGDTSEPEWVLERLSERLEGQLRAERDKSRGGRGQGADGLLSPATIPRRQDGDEAGADKGDAPDGSEG